jgi:hypothetical protein
MQNKKDKPDYPALGKNRYYGSYFSGALFLNYSFRYEMSKIVWILTYFEKKQLFFKGDFLYFYLHENKKYVIQRVKI